MLIFTIPSSNSCLRNLIISTVITVTGVFTGNCKNISGKNKFRAISCLQHLFEVCLVCYASCEHKRRAKMRMFAKSPDWKWSNQWSMQIVVSYIKTETVNNSFCYFVTRATPNGYFLSRFIEVVFSRFQLTVWWIKYQIIVKNGYHNFTNHKLTSANVLFYPINCSKPRDIQFTMIWNREKQQILSLENLTTETIWHIILARKIILMINWLSKWFADNFSE